VPGLTGRSTLGSHSTVDSENHFYGKPTFQPVAAVTFAHGSLSCVVIDDRLKNHRLRGAF
jgi:hypothetical protein